MAAKPSNWWRGDERTDPEGYRCRIGALWARWFLRKGWAMVANQTVWFRDEATWEAFLQQRHWRAHEHHHFWQETHYFKGQTWRYLLAFIWQYLRHRSHDDAPLEREAEEAADKAMTELETTKL